MSLFELRSNSLWLVIGLLGTLSLSACNSSQNNSLMTDATESTCPPGCASSLSASDNDIAIKIMNPTTTLASGVTRVDIGGECYPSLYPTNRILTTLTNTSGTAYTITAYNVGSAATVPFCNNGRFDIVVDLTNVPTSGVFTVQVSMVAYDSAGGAHSNSSDGVSTLTLRR